MDKLICKECKKEYSETTAELDFYCSPECQKSGEDKNYEIQVRYSAQGQYRAACESNPIRGQNI
jgi:hypothetical protein